MPAKDTILNYLAAVKANHSIDEVNKDEIGPALKIAGGSTIRKAIAALKQDGYVTVQAKMVKITRSGMDEADPDTFDNLKIPTTNQEKHDMVKGELNDKETAIFDTISDGRTHDKEELRVELGYPKNSTWRKLLAGLKKKNIAEYPNSQSIRLTTEMFPVVPRPE